MSFQCLEDLVVQYDGTVRNAIGEVVEFVYGADGLDPVFMETKNKPVDFERQLMHITSKFPFRLQSNVYSKQIKELANEILSRPEFEKSREDFKSESL